MLYEQYKEEESGRLCSTPWEHLEVGISTGNWTAPPGKGFPEPNQRPHDFGISQNYVITNPGARRCVDRDMNKVNCLSGAVEVPPDLDGHVGDTCPVALPPVVSRVCPTPGPCGDPGPDPIPSPTPGPEGVDSTGNYFLTWTEIKGPTCPARYVGKRSSVGVALLSRRPCSGGGDCEVINIHATEKSEKPFCSHSCYNEAGVFSPSFCRNKCETLPSCQYPADGFVEDPPGMFIAHPSFPEWPRWGKLDKRSSEQDSPVPGRDWRKTHIGHHRSEGESGTLFAMACPEGVTPGSVFDPTPPGCSRTEISLD